MCLDSSSGWLHNILSFISWTRQWHWFHRQAVIKWHNFLFLNRRAKYFQHSRLDIRYYNNCTLFAAVQKNTFPIWGRTLAVVRLNSPSNSEFQWRQKYGNAHRLLSPHNRLLQSQLSHLIKSCQTAESCHSGQPPSVDIRMHLFSLYAIKGIASKS